MTRRVRVFHLIKGLGRGGAEQLLVDGLRGGDRTRFEYGYGYFLPWKDALVGQLEALGGDVRCFASTSRAGLLAAVPRVALHLRRWRADVVHCHLPLSGVVGRLAGALARVPVIYTEHSLQERYHPLTRWSNSATWRLQRQVVAVSADVASSAARHGGDAVPVRVLRNGVAVERFAPDPAARDDVRLRLGLDAGSPVVGTVAGFRAPKRLDQWLEAARQVLDRAAGARFLLVGDGPLRGLLEQTIERLDLRRAVHLVGAQDDVRPFLAAMDVFASSSTAEGLPLALLEAMAMERAVAATRVGGVPEVVTSEVDGLLVPPERPDLLASAMLRLIDDGELRGRLGRAARARVADGFGVDRLVRGLEELYAEVGGA